MWAPQESSSSRHSVWSGGDTKAAWESVHPWGESCFLSWLTRLTHTHLSLRPRGWETPAGGECWRWRCCAAKWAWRTQRCRFCRNLRAVWRHLSILPRPTWGCVRRHDQFHGIRPRRLIVSLLSNSSMTWPKCLDYLFPTGMILSCQRLWSTSWASLITGVANVVCSVDQVKRVREANNQMWCSNIWAHVQPHISPPGLRP